MSNQQWCVVSKQTAYMNKRGYRLPSKQAAKLFLMHARGKALSSEWRDWSVKGGILVDPEGQETTQGQLRAYALVWQLASELSRKDPEAAKIFEAIQKLA